MNLPSAPFAAAGRLLLAPLFLISGFGKLAAPAATIGYIASTHAPLPEAAYAVAVLVEVGFGLALLLGLKTRPVAAVMALFTLATAVMFHTAANDANHAIHFWKNVAIAGGLLQLVAFGGGAWSLDAYLGNRVRTAPAL